MIQCRDSDTTDEDPIPADGADAHFGTKRIPYAETNRTKAPKQVGVQSENKGAKKKKLSNNAINFIVDFILLLSFMASMTICGIVQFIFPAAGKTTGWTLFGYGYESWIRALSVSLAIFGVLVLLHLILHWNWVCSFVTSRLTKFLDRKVTMDDSAKTIWGVAVLIVVLTAMGSAIAVAEFCIVEGGAAVAP